MPDREKVIKGLEAHVDGSGCMANCPYWTMKSLNCSVLLANDAFALLKAQEPRVMTLKEYEAWIDTPFTERNPVFHEERTKRGTVTCWVNTVVCTLREYGKNDRCWTSRPTDEQREATPWN